MGDTRSTVKVIFDGEANGIVAAAAEAGVAIELVERKAKAAGNEASNLGKGFDVAGRGALAATRGILALGGAVGSAQGIVALGGSLVTLSGAAAALPAVLGAGAVSLAVWKLASEGVGEAVKGKLTPAIDGLKASVTDDFLTGWDKELDGVARTTLPALSDGLGDVALQMGQAGVNVLQLAQAPPVIRDLNAVVGGSADLWDGLKTAPADVLAGIVALAAGGSGSLGDLGESVGTAAERFREWAEAARDGGQVTEWIADAKQEFQEWGQVASNVGGIVTAIFDGLSLGGYDLAQSLGESTAQLEAFLQSAEGQDALQALGEVLGTTAEVARDVFLTALRELGPVIVELAPAAQAVARAIGDFLVNALQTAGPILQGVAGFLSNNADTLATLTPLVLGAVAAYKGFQIAQSVAGWVSGAGTALGLFGNAADDAGKKVEGASRRLGLLKGAVAGLALGVVADQLNDMNIAAAGGEQNLQGVEENLNDLVGAGKQLLALDFDGIFDDIASEWEQTKRVWEGTNEINFDANTGPARDQVVTFMNAVKGTSGEVNIGGRKVEAVQALADIVQAINQGRGEVIIDGKPTPVQDALAMVIAQINAGAGEVTINGQTMPAGEALAMLLGQVNGSTGVVQIDGNIDPVTGKTMAAVAFADGSTGTVTLDGNPTLVNGKTVQAVQFADGSTGTITIDGQPDPANGKVRGVVTYANGSTGVVTLDADPSRANAKAQGVVNTWSGRVITFYLDGIVRTQDPSYPGSAGRARGGPIQGFALGGPIQGFAGGGIVGPGTGTSDSILAFAGSSRTPIRLSNGEYVVTAADVDLLGGFAGVERFLRALRSGALNAGLVTTPSAPARLTGGGSNVNVVVKIGDRELRDMIQAEVTEAARDAVRAVTVGTGVTF